MENKLTPEQWAKIPAGYDFVADDANGERYAYKTAPGLSETCWGFNNPNIEFVYIGFYKRSAFWKESLQKRPANDSPLSIPSKNTAIAEQPAPATQSRTVNLSPDSFAIITRQLGLKVTTETPGFVAPYQSAAIYSPVNGELLLVLVAPVVEPINVTVHDKVGETSVTIHDQL